VNEMGLKPRAKKTGTDAKTKPTSVSAASFINGLADERRRRESATLLDLMSEVTGEPPVMWGAGIVGFGSYHYKYASGREGDWPRTGFSPRKQSLTIYCVPGFAAQRDLLARLGPHKTSVSCLYINKLDDVDLGVLRKIVERSVDQMARTYGD